MVTPEQAARLGAWGVIASVQPNFDALWGGEHGMYAQRLGRDRGVRLNPLALLASQGVPLAFGSDSPVTSMNPWATVRAATRHQTPGSAVSMRAAFSAATRGAWRAGGVRDGVTGTLVPGAPASYAVWETDELEVSAPDDAVQRWSTDPRSRVPALPRARRPAAAMPADRPPGCRHPWLNGRRREWAKASDDTDIFPAVDDEDRRRNLPDGGGRPTGRVRTARRCTVAGQAIRAGGSRPAAPAERRHRRRAGTVHELPAVRLVVRGDRRVRAAGLGADPRVHHARRRIRIRLPVRAAFYLPAAAMDRRDGRRISVAHAFSLEAVFPALFGLVAVAVRRLPGWPIWFAGLWAQWSGPSRRCRSADSPGV